MGWKLLKGLAAFTVSLVLLVLAVVAGCCVACSSDAMVQMAGIGGFIAIAVTWFIAMGALFKRAEE